MQVLRCTVLYQTGLYKKGKYTNNSWRFRVWQFLRWLWACIGGVSRPRREWPGLTWPGSGRPVQQPHDLLHATCCSLDGERVISGDSQWRFLFFLIATKSCCWRRSSWNVLYTWSKNCRHDVLVKVEAPWISCEAPCHLGSRLSHHVLLPTAWKKLPTSRGAR
jgi:hypothetical protein